MFRKYSSYILAFWFRTTCCSLLGAFQRFGRIYWLHVQGWKLSTRLLHDVITQTTTWISTSVTPTHVTNGLFLFHSWHKAWTSVLREYRHWGYLARKNSPSKSTVPEPSVSISAMMPSRSSGPSLSSRADRISLKVLVVMYPLPN